MTIVDNKKFCCEKFKTFYNENRINILVSGMVKFDGECINECPFCNEYLHDDESVTVKEQRQYWI